jgi:hypothetical protein
MAAGALTAAEAASQSQPEACPELRDGAGQAAILAGKLCLLLNEGLEEGAAFRPVSMKLRTQNEGAKCRDSNYFRTDYVGGVQAERAEYWVAERTRYADEQRCVNPLGELRTVGEKPPRSDVFQKPNVSEAFIEELAPLIPEGDELVEFYVAADYYESEKDRTPRRLMVTFLSETAGVQTKSTGAVGSAPLLLVSYAAVASNWVNYSIRWEYTDLPPDRRLKLVEEVEDGHGGYETFIYWKSCRNRALVNSARGFWCSLSGVNKVDICNCEDQLTSGGDRHCRTNSSIDDPTSTCAGALPN